MLFGITSYSQSFFIKTGKNFTKFNYKNSYAELIDLHSDIGNTYEFGYNVPVKLNRFEYEVGLKLDEFKTYVEAPNKAVDYNLNYLGVNNTLTYSIIGEGRNNGRFNLNAKGGIILSKYVTGKQSILQKNYDLNAFPEFKNLFLIASLGLHAKFLISETMDMSIGYDKTISFLNTGNGNNQSLSFSSNEIKVGIYFLIN